MAGRTSSSRAYRNCWGERARSTCGADRAGNRRRSRERSHAAAAASDLEPVPPVLADLAANSVSRTKVRHRALRQTAGPRHPKAAPWEDLGIDPQADPL